MSFDNYCNHDHHHHKDCPGYFVPPKIQIPRPVGPRGPQGIPGIPGGLLGYVDFYNTTAQPNIAPDGFIKFANLAVSGGNTITPNAANDTFELQKNAKYLVLFQISATGSVKIGLSLNNSTIDYSIISNTGNTDTIGFSMIKTTDTKYQLSVQNADTNNLNVNADPSHLIILQLA